MKERVEVYAAGSGQFVGTFEFPRVPVKGDILNLLVNGYYEVVQVVMYNVGTPIILVRGTEFTMNPK